MKNRDDKKKFIKDKEMKSMPVIETIEYERVAYIEEMKIYLNNLKSMDKSVAVKISRENLIKSEIIMENGDFIKNIIIKKVR